jgi:hypothetical protein
MMGVWVAFRWSVFANVTDAYIGVRALTRSKAYPGKPPGTLSKALGREPLLATADRGPSRDPRYSANCSVALAISGGGSIAASYALGAIRRLADDDISASNESALSEVDYVSTASGGGIAGLLLLRAYLIASKGPSSLGQSELLRRGLDDVTIRKGALI